MLGERGLWYKMVFYERAMRVPLIFAGPGIRPRRRVREAVSHLDLLPTLARLCGAPVQTADLDGNDLRPAAKRAAPPAGEVFGEYMAEGYDAPMVMIRRGTRKFVYSRTEGPELYDLARDPLETRNLAREDRHRREVDGWLRGVAQRWDLDRVRTDVIASQKRRRAVHGALITGRIAPWDYAPKVDAAALYYRNYDPQRPDPDRRLRRPRPPG
jgi:choline-sulfatase